MATPSSKQKKVRAKKVERSSPRFEIVDEEPNPVAESWFVFRQLLDPWLEAGRRALGDVYSSIAQAVLEQKEELEDRRAERKTERRRAARKLGPRRASSPLPILEVGSLSKTSAKKHHS